MSMTEPSAIQGDIAVDALQRLSELALEIRDALQTIEGAVRTLASAGKG